MKRYRFFYHYYKAKGCMSVHFRGQCIPVENVDCRVPATTKWNTRQPRLVLQGYAHSVTVEANTAVIE